MLVTAGTDIASQDDLEGVARFSAIALDQLKTAVNGQIDTQNLRCFITTVSFVAANTAYNIQHKLGVIPKGYWKIAGPDIRIFDVPSLPATINNIYIQSTAVGTATIMVMG